MSTSRKPVEIKAPARSRSRPARMGPLASLPVFFQLKARKVLLAGGTDAAAWKAELLAATGAEVHVYASGDLDPAMEKLLDAGSVKGSFVLHPEPWSAKAFSGMTLAICDAASDGEAQAFYCSAKSAGVPVNVIDNPPFCEFQFGSIVNRSPVVIGISTNGVAPILGQAIRRRIETLLPQPLTSWAGLAGRIREHVLERLAPGPQRRRFWERFTELAFSETAAPEAGDEMQTLIDAALQPEGRGEGKVTLVGAGPGGAEYLTIKAVRALQAADVILFDDLVADEVLELARREAKRMLVGKRGGRESCLQEDINDLMVDLALKGKNVVRLKSGDPMVFGRAGEEIERLKSEGIPVSVVPGITSASAMAATLGVSLTHRDHAQAVRFVTGHSRKGDLPDAVDWRALADPATTTVFYMGGRMSARISARLIEEGRSPATPVVVMAGITRAGEKRWSGPLSELASGIKSLDTAEPVLIGVGEVFSDISSAQVRSMLETANLNDVSGLPVQLTATS